MVVDLWIGWLLNCRKNLIYFALKIKKFFPCYSVLLFILLLCEFGGRELGSTRLFEVDEHREILGNWSLGYNCRCPYR